VREPPLVHLGHRGQVGEGRVVVVDEDRVEVPQRRCGIVEEGEPDRSALRAQGGALVEGAVEADDPG
jgi:hypothetical protein